MKRKIRRKTKVFVNFKNIEKRKQWVKQKLLGSGDVAHRRRIKNRRGA
jgi:hypothetical protein